MGRGRNIKHSRGPSQQSPRFRAAMKRLAEKNERKAKPSQCESSTMKELLDKEKPK